MHSFFDASLWLSCIFLHGFINIHLHEIQMRLNRFEILLVQVNQAAQLGRLDYDTTL